jgi:hypothetical protein
MIRAHATPGLLIELAIILIGMVFICNELRFLRTFSQLQVGAVLSEAQTALPPPQTFSSSEDRLLLGWQAHLLPLEWWLEGDTSTGTISRVHTVNKLGPQAMYLDPPEPPCDSLFRLAFVFSLIHLSWRAVRAVIAKKKRAVEQGDAPDEAQS